MDNNTALRIQALNYLETAITGYSKKEHELIVDHLAEQHPSWEGIGDGDSFDCPLCILTAERLADAGDLDHMYITIRIGELQAFWTLKLKKNKKFKERMKLMKKALGDPQILTEPKGAEKRLRKHFKKKGW